MSSRLLSENNVHAQPLQIEIVEKKISAVFEQRFQALESKYMGLLERVVESNEVVKS